MAKTATSPGRKSNPSLLLKIISISINSPYPGVAVEAGREAFGFKPVRAPSVRTVHATTSLPHTQVNTQQNSPAASDGARHLQGARLPLAQMVEPHYPSPRPQRLHHRGRFIGSRSQRTARRTVKQSGNTADHARAAEHVNLAEYTMLSDQQRNTRCGIGHQYKNLRIWLNFRIS